MPDTDSPGHGLFGDAFRLLADSIPQLAWIAESDGSIIWYNRRWYEYTGKTFEEMRGWGWSAVHHRDHLDRVIETFRRAVAGGSPWEDTFPLLRHDGQWRWFLSRAMPVLDANRGVAYWFGTNTDVTEQRESESERARLLRETEEQRALLDAIFENAPVGMAFWDREIRYTRLNRSLAEMNGLPVEAHLGRTPAEALPQLGPGVMPVFHQVLDSGDAVANLEVRGATYASSEPRRTWLASFYPVRVGEATIGIGGIVNEITERKRAQEELESISQRLEMHLRNTPAAVLEFDSSMRVQRWSGAAERMLGWTAEEAHGKTADELGLLHEEDAARLGSMVGELVSGERASFFSSNRNVRKDGGIIHVDWYNSSIRDGDGRLISMLSFGVDVTERMQAQEALHRHSEALARSNAELQQFAYAASHDLQEPLRMVILYTELLRRKYKGRLDDDADMYIGHAVEGARRMEQLLRDLLDYSRLSMPEDRVPSPVHSGAVLERVLFTLAGSIAEAGAKVSCGELPAVPVQEVHLLQLFQNLLSNSLKYRREEEPLQIYVGAKREGGLWLFEVRDNGSGIPPEYHRQIFGLFKRLHSRKYAGTGIGLSICQRIVERYGGAIWVESAGLGHGSSFFFTLPAE